MLHFQQHPISISPLWVPSLSSTNYSFPLTPSPNQTRTLRVPTSHSHQHQRLKPYHRARSDFDLRSNVLSPITPNSATQHSIPCFPPSCVKSSVSRENSAVPSANPTSTSNRTAPPPQTPRATIQRSVSLPQLQLPFPITPYVLIFIIKSNPGFQVAAFPSSKISIPNIPSLRNASFAE
ncbi:hypothetical protein FRC02_005570 [Tulasnella sp. 418]|nr:hypothetical protein FRC02_005570 [Tulasnella sp. 418]